MIPWRLFILTLLAMIMPIGTMAEDINRQAGRGDYLSSVTLHPDLWTNRQAIEAYLAAMNIRKSRRLEDGLQKNVMRLPHPGFMFSDEIRGAAYQFKLNTALITLPREPETLAETCAAVDCTLSRRGRAINVYFSYKDERPAGFDLRIKPLGVADGTAFLLLERFYGGNFVYCGIMKVPGNFFDDPAPPERNDEIVMMPFLECE